MLKNFIDNKINTEEKPSVRIDGDTAKDDFKTFCFDWDIDTDEDDFTAEEKESFENLQKTIVKKIKSGHLVYNRGEETFSYTLVKPIDNLPDSRTLTIHRTKGQAALTMDKYKEKELIHKTYSLLAAMIKMPVGFISKLDSIDLKVIQAIQTLFLTS